jgi:hypothetical protein
VRMYGELRLKYGMSVSGCVSRVGVDVITGMCYLKIAINW